MALHFTPEELSARRARAIAAMTAAGLDGLLLFKQESHYYLTGFDTYGFVFFQCLYLGADGRMTLLARAPELRQAQLTSVIEDVRIWVDDAAANPAAELRGILDEHGCRGKRLGIELESYGLTGRNAKRIEAALEGFCTLEDASHLVDHLRVVKSSAELEYVRRAAELADDALAAGLARAGPGAFEGNILAEMMATVFRGGGDFPAHDYIIGSGEEAMLYRYHSGRRHLDARDQLFLEFGAAYRHYHANLIQTVVIGKPSARQTELNEAVVASYHAGLEALRPGRPIGEVFDAHARSLDDAGFRALRMNACGYSLGATFLPNWMDWPMFYHGNPVLAEPNMVFFPQAFLSDTENGYVMGVGQTVVVTGKGYEPLSRSPLEMAVR